MKILKLAVLSAATLFCMESCKKENALQTHSQENVTTSQQNQGVKMKINQISPNLDEKQTLNMINNFKQKGKNSSAKAMGDDPQDNPLESAVFEMEATLNYDYDMTPNEDCKTFARTSFITAPLDANGFITNDDLQNVYLAYKDSVDVFTNDSTKIKLIDVEATVDQDASTVTFGMKAVAYSLLSKTNCAPYTGMVLSPSKNKWVTGVCCAPPFAWIPDAPTVLTSKFNCLTYVGCTWGYYFTNVTPFVDQTSSNLGNPAVPSSYPSSMLYSSGYKPHNPYPQQCIYSYFCGNYDYISPADLNGYKSLMTAYVTSNPAPPGFITVHVGVTDHLAYNSAQDRSIYWSLDIDHGKRVCRSAPPQ